jgi:N-acetylmuramoyl-L-alanine amidase
MLPGKDDQDNRLVNRSRFSEAMRYIAITLGVSVLLATLFTAWAPASLNPAEAVGKLLTSMLGSEETLTPATPGAGGIEGEQEIRVGIVAGHSGLRPDTGLPDPGATCDDGLTELEVNSRIAELVVQGLQDAGLEVDLLEEFDRRLAGYQASALVSIHADSCFYFSDEATGYKVAPSAQSPTPEKAQRLVDCIADRYGKATRLHYHQASVTRDMTEYHSFFEIDPDTPAAIIETGFLYLDRDFLTGSPEIAARGIVDGVLCFLNNEPVFPMESQP